MGSDVANSPARVLQRYVVYDRFAQGGMASVHFGRLVGPVGFSRTVAIKQLHSHLAEDPEFVSMLVDEARLASRIHHPNVVQTLDVVAAQGELFIVLDYVHGESLSKLGQAARAAGEPIPTGVAASIVFDVLQGLHAAHEARDLAGQPLEIVHRDVSPQNVLVGTDGVARVIDFGVAKARGRAQTTRQGQLKGKLAYMAPEQIRGEASPRSDVFSASVVLWEALTGRRLFEGEDEAGIVGRVLTSEIDTPIKYAPQLSRALVEVVTRGLARDPAARFASAREMAVALESSVAFATPFDVGSCVERLAREALSARTARVAAIEAASMTATALPPSSPGAASLLSLEPFSESSATAPIPGLAQPREARAPIVRNRAVTLRTRAGAIAALLGSAAVVVATWGRAHRAAPLPPSTRASVGDADVAEVPPPSAEEAPSPPSVWAQASGAPVPSATAGRKPAKLAPHPRPRPGCSPPYVTDAMGFRHYRPECL